MPECLTCGRSFEARSDARYCSDACRQQAYRDRRRGNCNAVTDAQAPSPKGRRVGGLSDVTRAWLRAHKGQRIAALKVRFRKGEGMSVK